MAERFTLEKPLVIEAIIELRFKRDFNWQRSFAGKLFKRIESEYPNEETRQLFELPPGGPPVMRERSVFRNDSETRLVQSDVRLLVFNQLAPYPDWDSVRDAFSDVYRSHVEEMGELPLQRLGLRYINRAPVEKIEDVADMLSAPPVLQQKLGFPLANFYSRHEVSLAELNGVLIHQAGVGVHEQRQVLMLDLDALIEEPASSHSALVDVLNTAHQTLEDVFVASLSKPYFESLKPTMRGTD